ncbi:Protein ERGIC-53-like [Apodemus speciosus]|uniref:Protein ERGIC-53-like n=1 Tax=Apodemus speciosus TaxID=105296 RepID=A0ABQ0F4R9_APOSI
MGQPFGPMWPGCIPIVHRDGGTRELGSCHRDFRNRPYPFRARITYWRQRLRVSLSGGLTPNDPEEVLRRCGTPDFSPWRLLWGLSSHQHLSRDVPQPFLEKEQFHLARKLEELKAKLALGTREDSLPPLNSKAREEGESFFNLEDTLGRQSQILQALQALSRQMDHAERQWKQQLASTLQVRPEGGWNAAKVSTLLYGQRNLIQALQEMRETAAQMASRAQVFYLPVGTKHHFFDLDQILSLLQKDLRDLVKKTTKSPRPSGWLPGSSTCLRTSIFLVFLLIQAVGFFCYVSFRQELDKRLQECLSTGSLALEPALSIPRTIGLLRRQPVSPSMQA